MSELSERIKVMREMAFASTDGVQKVLRDIYDMLDANEDSLKQCYEVDKDGTNKKENLIIKRMLDAVQDAIDYQFADTEVHEMIDERRVLEFKQNVGVIGVIYNGDVYATVELITKALKTNNAIILNVGINDYIGTNNLIVKSIKEILEKNNKPSGLVEINFSENEDLANEDLDQIIVIGDRAKQTRINALNLNVIKSGYGHGEIYVDDLENEKFIRELLSKVDYDIKVYVKENLATDIPGTRVANFEEAINRINAEGAGYAAAIFANDAETQRAFMKRVRCKFSFVNASPSIARELDIYIADMYYKKVGMV